MLIIKCAKCKTKLFKYHKIGKGKVLKCHKSRIHKRYHMEFEDEEVCCPCGNLIGKNENRFIKMNDCGFTYTGPKD